MEETIYGLYTYTCTHIMLSLAMVVGPLHNLPLETLRVGSEMASEVVAELIETKVIFQPCFSWWHLINLTEKLNVAEPLRLLSVSPCSLPRGFLYPPENSGQILDESARSTALSEHSNFYHLHQLQGWNLSKVTNAVHWPFYDNLYFIWVRTMQSSLQCAWNFRSCSPQM